MPNKTLNAEVQIINNNITEVLNEASRYIDTHGLEPKTNSLADIELKLFENPTSLLTAYSQATILIEVAGDHLLAIAKTFSEPAQSIAPWALARAVLETSAISYWLLDPSIDYRERVSRSLALRYENLLEQQKFCKNAGLHKEKLIIQNRIEEIEVQAVSIGYEQLRNKKGDRKGIGQVMPSVSEIIRITLDEESTYRFLSAMTHGLNWAITPLSFKKVAMIDYRNTSLVLMEKSLSINMVIWLSHQAIQYYIKPIIKLSELFGWDLPQFTGEISV